MKISHDEIYRSEFELYDNLVSREDHENNLFPAIATIFDYSQKEVIELGAGTGRLTAELAKRALSIKAFDSSENMLGFAKQKLKAFTNVHFEVGEHTKIDSPDDTADLVIAGWTIGYLTNDEDNYGLDKVERCLNEIKRVLKPKGKIIIIETLGTGNKVPKAPLKRLEKMYSLLEAQGFSRTVVRTDYKFESEEVARRTVGSFFGEEIIVKLEKSGKDFILPECTGVWFLQP